MKLTQIKLAGFKSFTDPTTIHLPGQLVAVIGPNGCGKSNVIDAVRWVLGEASAKQLRGESMQDVIFNGALTRRPAPRASVELVFDNSDKSLQGSWGQYAEVSIKRQLTRQGESTYYINNQVVRRRDITDLFLGTGVGARGYAVIEQGMISRIIEARPEELRAYIEEAAGVSKYKERRKETEARLKDTREHLHRIADLQSELGRQVEKLEKQAATAERYRLLSEQLAHQQDLLDYTQWQQALQAADRATEQYQTFLQRQEETSAENQQTNEAFHALRSNEQEQQQLTQNISNQRAMLREQIARLEEQLRSQHNLQQRIERERQTAQSQLQRIHQERQTLLSESELLTAELEDKQIELSEWAVQVSEREAHLPELEEQQHQLNSAFQSQEDELNRLKRELALKQQQLAHLKQNLQQQNQRQGRLQAEQQALNLPASAELDAAQQYAQQLHQQHEEYELLLSEGEDKLSSLQQSFQTGIQHYNALYQQHISLQAQQQAIEAVLPKGDAQDFWHGTAQAKAGELWQHVSVSPDWQHALSVVLAGRLQARAVPADFRPPSPLPEAAAAWCHAEATPAKKTQPAQALINQIQVRAPFQNALSFWLDGILCAPSLDFALSHQGDLQGTQIWLTPEGHQIDRAGAVIYHQDAADNLLKHQARLEELTQQLAELTPKLAEAEQKRDAAQAALSQQEEQQKQLTMQQRQHAAKLHSAQAEATALLARTNQGQLRREHIEQELLQLAEEQLIQEQSLETLHNDSLLLEETVHTLSGQQQNLNETRQTVQNQLKQARLALLEANRQYGIIEVAVHKQQQRQQSLQHQISVLQQQDLDWQERQSELALAFESEQQDEEQREKLECLSEEVLTLDEQFISAQDRLADIQRQGQEMYGRQQQLAATLPQLQAATQTALLQQQEALINAKRYHENLSEREADIDALAKLAEPSADSRALGEYIGNLAREIETLGAVNLAALQELNEARERDTYYRSQNDDIQSAIDLLEQAIAQIDDETKARFKETFDAVNESVHRFFPTLFGGGEATLQMVGDDLLTAGVSIMARPPGKKNSTIHLLSGGEKALTAMSLVFALFSLNPAPFCLLDEVDAPLDDANTGRFCNLVKEMSANTQFLYISHNRLTMEMAEQLIGVTMQEKGVSRIVAVDIQQALSMAESA
jgi:chromosome segregation protein